MNDAVKIQKLGKCLSALHSPTSPFTDPIIAGAPSVIIVVSFAVGRSAFAIVASIASFTFMPRVLSFNGTILSSFF